MMSATSAQVCWGPSETGEDHWSPWALLSPSAHLPQLGGQCLLRSSRVAEDSWWVGKVTFRGLWGQLGLKMLVSVASCFAQTHIHMHTYPGPLAGLPGLANKSTFGFQVNSVFGTYLDWKNYSTSEIRLRVTVSGHLIWQSYSQYVWTAKPPPLCPTYYRYQKHKGAKEKETGHHQSASKDAFKVKGPPTEW